MATKKLKDIAVFEKKAYELLSSRYVHLTDEKKWKLIGNYIDLVTQEVWRYWLSVSILGDLAFCRKSSIYNKSNQVRLEKGSKRRIYMDKWFNENCALYKIVEKGQGGKGIDKKLTLIQLTYDLTINGKSIDTLVAEINDIEKDLDIKNEEERQKLLSVLYGNNHQEYLNYENDKTIADTVLVNMVNLKRYIRNKIKQKKRLKDIGAELQKGMNKKIKEATRIYRTAELCDGELIQIINESEFGRKYYKSVNLQSVSKEVRLAALGSCIEYDFENSVYAWRMNKALGYGVGKAFDKTQYYLDNKNKVRKRVTELVFGKGKNNEERAENEKKIKQVFTAISFGAKGGVKNIYFTNANGALEKQAINTVLIEEEQRKRFYEDDFVNGFVKEQTAITKLIIENEEKELLKNSLLVKDNGKLERNKALSFMYQKAEREIMDACVSFIKKKDLLLLVHDAFYVSGRDISKTAMSNIKRTLRKHNKLIKIDRQVHTA